MRPGVRAEDEGYLSKAAEAALTEVFYEFDAGTQDQVWDTEELQTFGLAANGKPFEEAYVWGRGRKEKPQRYLTFDSFEVKLKSSGQSWMSMKRVASLCRDSWTSITLKRKPAYALPARERNHLVALC